MPTDRSLEGRSPISPSSSIWQRLQAESRPEPENSILLRVFVQILVTIGIIATDVASANVTEVGLTSLWAVPVSGVGATWSWFRRRSRNIPTKFCIAIAMLLALATFFVRLLGEQQDTRLALAQLLIQLQVFHSFDLPRRKDLGYSMMIGLILLGVAGTLSQTLAFAPLLLAFLAIALPTLVLDYRSQLGLLPQTVKAVQTTLPLRRIGLILAVTITLGLFIFAALPRFQGYQIRTFPVSSPIDYDGEFNPSSISNPGYVSGGEGEETGFGTDTEDGETFSSAPGEVDSQSYYGFSSRINQNLRGDLTPTVVMRVRSQAEGFWRVLAFDRYTGQGWEISRNREEDMFILDRVRWNYMFRLPWLIGANRTREVIQTYTITAELPNLIPALYEAKNLYFPTQQIAIDPEGGLRSPINLVDGITYTVVSEVPYRDRTALGQAETSYTDDIRDAYLQVPESIAATVQQQTEAILAEAPTRPSNPYEISLYLAQYLKQHYTLQPDLPFLEPGEDLVQAFLQRYEGGYPDHFSTVLTMMLRSAGIPARLVAGFASGEFNPFTGFYLVRNTDAYAMTEVYFPNYGWFAFDPIPGHEVIPPTVEDYETFGVLKQFWNWVAGWLPSPVRGIVSGLIDLVTESLSRAIAFLTSLLTQGWIGVLVGLSIITGLAFGVWLLWSGWKLLAYRFWLRRLPPMESLYQQMLNELAIAGFRKPRAQTPLEYAQVMRGHHGSHQVKIIDDISHAYVRWRYGRIDPDIPKLKQQLRSLRRPRRSRRFKR